MTRLFRAFPRFRASPGFLSATSQRIHARLARVIGHVESSTHILKKWSPAIGSGLRPSRQASSRLDDASGNAQPVCRVKRRPRSFLEPTLPAAPPSSFPLSPFQDRQRARSSSRIPYVCHYVVGMISIDMDNLEARSYKKPRSRHIIFDFQP